MNFYRFLKVFNKFLLLRNVPFINWPTAVQRIFFLVAAFILFLIINKNFFNSFEKTALYYHENNKALLRELKINKKNIQSSKLHPHESKKILDENSDDKNFKDYPLSSLKLMGTLSQGLTKFAFISDFKNRIHILKLGDSVGLEKAKIINIGMDEIQLTWSINKQAFLNHFKISMERDG